MSSIQDSINPTRGLQKSKCPYCGETIKYFIRETWLSHLEKCKR